MQPVQEGLHLVLDLHRHLRIAHLIDVFLFILIGDRQMLPVGDQLLVDHLPEVVDSVAEVEVESSDVICPNPLQVFVESLIKVFHILDIQSRPTHMLVKRASKESLEQKPFLERLTYHPPYELKVPTVVGVDVGVGVGLESGLVGDRLEEGVVGVEDLLGEKTKPLSGESALVVAPLVLELDLEVAPNLVRPLGDQLREGVHEDLLPPDRQLEGLVPVGRLFQRPPKVGPLILEVDDPRFLLEHTRQHTVQDLNIFFDEIIQEFFIVLTHEGEELSHRNLNHTPQGIDFPGGRGVQIEGFFSLLDSHAHGALGDLALCVAGDLAVGGLLASLGPGRALLLHVRGPLAPVVEVELADAHFLAGLLPLGACLLVADVSEVLIVA